MVENMVENMFEIIMLLIAVVCGWLSFKMFKKQKQMNIQREIEREERRKELENTDFHETFATGLNYHTDEVNGIVEELRDKFGDDIDGSPLACQMVAEPDNEFDSNAIRIEMSTNAVVWYRVGYVPKRDIAIVREGMEKGVAFNAEYKFKEDYKQPHQFEVWWKVTK